MSANEIVTLVMNLGFPIAAYIFLFIYVQKREEKHDAERTEERKDHKAETEKLAEAVNNNTLMVQKLIEKMDKGC